MNQNNKGLIILNLGSPDSYSVPDVKNYLREFLMDERVIDVKPFWRNILVKGFILPFRSPKSAEAYRSVWTEKGSPLKVITDEFKELVQAQLDMPVSVSMRYGNPTPEAAIRELQSKCDKLEEILIAPMYPHYAMSSYETAIEHMISHIRKLQPEARLRVLKPFYNEPAYIKAMAASIRPYLQNDNFDGYLFSYHGLPIRHLKKSDPTSSHCYVNDTCCEVKSIAWENCYKHQVKETTRLVAQELQLEASKIYITFQSRLGTDKWIQPFTDKVLEELPARGVKNLMVLCPAFVADCLETLEEMDDRGKESFMEKGGENFVRVPCMNTHPEWVSTLVNYCKDINSALWMDSKS